MKKSSRKNSEKRGSNNDVNPSVVSLLLEVAKDEYSKERERANSLDNKTNVFITVMFAVITLYVPKIPFSEIKNVYADTNKMNIVFVTVFMVLSLISIGYFVRAFYWFFKALSVRAYMRVNVNALNDDVVFLKSNCDVAIGLLNQYDIILENNSRINDDRAAKLTDGIKYCIRGVTLLSIVAMGLWIIV